MMRISVTTIESFRRFYHGTFYDIEKDGELIKTSEEVRDEAEQKFIRELQGEFIVTPAMERGTAFHSILENPELYKQGDFYVYNGIKFSSEIVNRCLPLVPRGGAFEVKTTKVYRAHSCSTNPQQRDTVLVVGKVDQLIGITIREHKTRWSGVDYESYNNSCQWRFYIDMFGLPIVMYNVFEMYDGALGIVLKDIHKYVFHQYPNLQDDVHDLLSDFLRYIHAKNLESYFQPKQEITIL